MKTKLTKLFIEFIESEQASGMILFFCAFISMTIANSSLGQGYSDFWRFPIGLGIGDFSLNYSLTQWINKALMAIFFLLIGLEIERELYIGELADVKKATLPVCAALGGIVAPMAIHLLLNHGTETQGGFAIPMATDIAFALGALALLGDKAPVALKIFLTALAIIDDLGAILVIALFYASDFSILYLVLALGVFVGLLLLNRYGVSRLSFYLIPGIALWYFMLKSGIHASLAGVLLAFAIPFRRGDQESPSVQLQHFLHKPVAFIIMPLFALANTGVVLTGNWLESFATTNSLGILAGLFIGKPLGIVLFCVLAVKLGLSQLPNDVSWKHILGVGFLGGIGFTMSIFITLLAFNEPKLIESSKIVVLASSLIAGFTGFMILNRLTPALSPATDTKDLDADETTQ